MSKVTASDRAGVPLSETVIVTVDVPDADGEPEIRPSVSIDRPAGSPLSEYVSVDVSRSAASIWRLNGAPVMPA